MKKNLRGAPRILLPIDRPLEASLTESFARSYHWKDGVADNDIHYSQSPGSDPPAGGLWNGGKLGRVEA